MPKSAPLRRYSVTPTQYCSALNCRNTRAKNRNLSFFRFPKDRDRCMKWVENCRRTELQGKDPASLYQNYAFCADHFEDSQFMNVLAKNRLVWNAIPTIFDVPNPPLTIAEEKLRASTLVSPSTLEECSNDTEQNRFSVSVDSPMNDVMEIARPSSVTSTAPALEDDDDICSDNVGLTDTTTVPLKHLKLADAILTPQEIRQMKTRQLVNRQRIKIWRLKKQVKALQSKVETTKLRNVDNPEGIIRAASKYMSEVALNFFANQIRMADKKNRGKRWTRENQYFALILNCISEDAYHFCSKVFNLPTVRTLQRWLKGFRQEQGFEQQLQTFKETLLCSTEEKRSVFIDVHSDAEDKLIANRPVTAVLQLSKEPVTLQHLNSHSFEEASMVNLSFLQTTSAPEISASNVSKTERRVVHCPLQSLTEQLLKINRLNRLKPVSKKKLTTDVELPVLQ